ncbi:Rieske 2Fe-2S domain-containing protein [Streptomyces sp. JJ66]|uniref:Rieske 2Fe-2S domain-containing protein n=1 Tax=Streptomyces sp. JJ66 TaxID=2803843 RepID=UPI001C562ED7|nr:Rieske 2Fe-2S domain-containing protein [Streptomyces sp. JJ66]MBW1600782.1 Rieske 2Fe-2S domain-containing protein [Streptomyces sp. JJ66]
MRHRTSERLAASARPVTNLASGWYVALSSAELRRRPRRITLFGNTYVGWRGENGQARVQSAVCPHAGAALHGGKVVDGTLECPFHRWRFDESGACVFVPGRRPPARAAVATLPTRERSGYVWAWYGSRTPRYEPPDLPGLEARRFPGVRSFRLADPTRATTRRILENTYDPDHLVALHGLTVTGEARIVFPDGRERAVGDGAPDDGPSERCDATLTWSAYRGALGTLSNAFGLNAREFTLRMRGWASCQEIEYYADGRRLYRMILAVTPVGEHHSIQHISAAVDPDGAGALGWLRSLVHRAEVQVAARQDLPVFDTLLPGDRHGIYVPGDEGVRRFRRFYQQWVEVAEHG